jgi:hypothetical protein
VPNNYLVNNIIFFSKYLTYDHLAARQLLLVEQRLLPDFQRTYSAERLFERWLISKFSELLPPVLALSQLISLSSQTSAAAIELSNRLRNRSGELLNL